MVGCIFTGDGRNDSSKAYPEPLYSEIIMGNNNKLQTKNIINGLDLTTTKKDIETLIYSQRHLADFSSSKNCEKVA